LSSTNTIVDRLVLRQGKKPHQYAQTLFCGGPIAAIAVCPRTLPNGLHQISLTIYTQVFSLKVVNWWQLPRLLMKNRWDGQRMMKIHTFNSGRLTQMI
jgi:hypothetical protein